MSRILDPAGGYQSNDFAADGITVGCSFSQLTTKDVQPIWNEERTGFIVAVGKIFDRERLTAYHVEPHY
jgi:hypothetical protein